MTFSLPATFLADFVHTRLKPMWLEVCNLCVQPDGLSFGDRCYTYYEPTANTMTLLIYQPALAMRTSPRGGGAPTHRFQIQHTFTLSAIFASSDTGFWGRYPNLYWTFAPTVPIYFNERTGGAYTLEMEAYPYIAPETTQITDGTFFGIEPGGEYPVTGVNFTLVVAFNINTDPYGSNH